MLKKHPQLTDYCSYQLQYGFTEYGIGLYTTDLKFFWPELTGMSEREYNSWTTRLEELGYDIPEGYKDCYLRKKVYSIDRGV